MATTGGDASPRIKLPSLTPTLRLGTVLITALGALVCGVMGYSSAYALFLLSLLLTALGTVWPWVSIHGLRSRLEFFGDRAYPGQPVQAVLIVQNRWPWPVWCVVLSDSISETQADTLLWIDRLTPRRTQEFFLHLSPTRRGFFPRNPLCVACSFPFGLWKARRQVEIPVPMIVWPKPLAVDVEDVLGCDDRGALPHRVHRPGPDGEMVGVRPYRRGDGMRQIHWRQTARHDRLIVREFQQTVRPAAVIIVDTDLASYDMQEHQREQSIGLAAGLIERLSDLGGELTLLVDGRIHRHYGQTAKNSLLDALALVTDRDNPTFAHTMLKVPSLARGVPVLITGRRISQEHVEGLGPRVRTLVLSPQELQASGVGE